MTTFPLGRWMAAAAIGTVLWLSIASVIGAVLYLIGWSFALAISSGRHPEHH